MGLFAGKPRSYKDSVKFVGARLAREGGLTGNTNPGTVINLD